MTVQGMTCVVTGAGNGIGREVTLELLRRGAKVAGLDINNDWLQETGELAGPAAKNFLPLVCDISDRKAVLALPKKISPSLGDVSAVVNVAGIIQPFVRVNELEFDAIDKVMAVNLFGVINLIKTFLPTLLTQPSAHLVNTSSMGSYAPVPGQTVYGASKAAVNLLSEGLRSELSDSNVAVTLVYPGAIGTNIASNSGLTMDLEGESDQPRKMVRPADAGRMIVDAMAAKKKRIFIGSDAKIMYRMGKLNQDMAANAINNAMKDLLK
jgi:short-subunit dehydrogenase